MSLPNDPIVPSQWYLQNTGQRGAPGIDLNLLPIWGRYSGKGVIIAVNDDGMDLEHPDLVANLLVNLAYDGARETLGQGFSSPNDPDANAHGTVVGSIIGMVSGNGLGGVGIASGAKIVPALNAFEPGKTAKVFLSNLAANASVSVNSWGDDQAFAENFGASGSQSDREWGAALTRLVTEGRNGLGMVIGVSGGNERGNGADVGLSSFTGNKFTIAVGAVTHDGKPTDYSSPGASLLVTAPGGVGSEDDTGIDRGFGIASADVSGTGGYNKAAGAAGDYAFQNQGTSYSQPMVMAIAALMIEANPTLGFRDVSSILALTARKTDATNSSWVQQKGTEWNLGGMHFSRDFGYGLVDAAAAVRLAESWAGGTNTMANWVSAEGISATPSGAIPDNPATNFIFEATATVARNITIERLEVDIGLTMALPNQLGAVLVSPSGTMHTLFDRPLTRALESPGPGQAKAPTGPEKAWPGVFTMGLTAFMGESSAGTWSLRLLDLVTGETATFNSFAVRAWGKAPGSDNQYIFTDEYSGTNTLTDAAGIDTVNAAAVAGPVSLSLAAGGTSTLPNGSFTLAGGTVIENAFGGAGNDRINGNALNNHLRGNEGNDSISGGAGNDLIFGGLGKDTLDGGAGTRDIVDYRGSAAVEVNLQLGAGGPAGNETDSLLGFEAIFGSSAGDRLRGLDGDAAKPGETFRGGAGNDTIDGGTGIDLAEFSAARAAYSISRTPGTLQISVVHNGGGVDGTDTLDNVELLLFSDRVIGFGPRVEDVARVAFALWTPPIIGSPSLFAKGISFYTNEFGYGFDFLCQVALQYWPETGAQTAARLKASIPAVSFTTQQLIDIMAANGGVDSAAGRAAAVKAVAQDPAMTAQLELAGVFSQGVTAAFGFPGESPDYFGPLPG